MEVEDKQEEMIVKSPLENPIRGPPAQDQYSVKQKVCIDVTRAQLPGSWRLL